MGERTSTQLGATDDAIFNPFTYQAQLSTCSPHRSNLKMGTQQSPKHRVYLFILFIYLFIYLLSYFKHWSTDKDLILAGTEI
jgi:hypothetical protein